MLNADVVVAESEHSMRALTSEGKAAMRNCIDDETALPPMKTLRAHEMFDQSHPNSYIVGGCLLRRQMHPRQPCMGPRACACYDCFDAG